MPPHTGSVISSDPRAAAQAKSIGATIGGDGWWYKDGKKLSTKEADRLTNEAGSAITSTDTAHGERARDIWGRGSDLVSKGYAATGLNKVKIGGWVGDTYERNKGDILAAAGTVASGGNPLVGAAIKAGMEGAKRGATGGDAIKGGVSGYMLGSGVSGAMGGFANAGAAGTSKLVGAAKGYMNPNLMDFTGKGTKAATAGYSAVKASNAAALTAAPGRLANLSNTIDTGRGLAGMGAAPVKTAQNLATSTNGNDMGFFSGLKRMFTGGDANKKTPLENALAVGTGAYNAYSGYKRDQAKETNDKRNIDQREAESLRNYGLAAAKEARDARIQSISEEDRKRILMIMQNRDAELSPVREQLMKAIMGGDSTLFGGSVMKGLGSKGYI